MASSTGAKLSQKAYVKLMLHACKHHSSGVNGILLGEKVVAGQDVQVLDVVPLFHTSTLSPMLEVALDMVRLAVNGAVRLLGGKRGSHGGVLRLMWVCERRRFDAYRVGSWGRRTNTAQYI